MTDKLTRPMNEYDPATQICIVCDKPITLCDCYCNYCGKFKDDCTCGCEHCGSLECYGECRE